MISSDEPQQYLSRDVDYLGMLGANLRNLTGLRSLAHELIQNADDSDGASTVSFDFRDEGLVVRNDGVFSDCGSRELAVADCAFRALDELTCDFHSFRLIAGGTKRLREGTTGAFGIGFTAVYQITDRPELISSGAHWILDETKLEDRIRVCRGCSSCDGADGTTFILPWASDPESEMRRALKVSAVNRDDIPLFVQELQEDALDSLLFLRRLDQLQLKEEGEILTQTDRHVEADAVIISDGSTDRVFHLLRGSFETAATKLRTRYGDRVEGTRESSVAVAVPEEDLAGLVYAFLPTQIPTRIGCHVQADFFPTSDRKQLIFETDYQSEWNRQALSAAASALADGLPKIRASVGEVQVWKILRSVLRLHQESAAPGATHWRSFWDKLRNVAQRGPITKTSSGSWAALSDVTLIELPSTQEALPALEALGIATVASSIRSLVFEMRGGEGVRPSILTPSDLVDGFERHGMTRRLAIEDMPSALQNEAMRATLLRELDRMLHQRSAADRERELELLAGHTILPGSDGAIWPPSKLWRANAPTRALFRKLIPNLAFLELDEVPKEAGSLVDLSPELSGAPAAQLLVELEPDVLQATVRTDDKLTESLLTWFTSHRESLDVDDAPRMVASLPIYPSAGALRPLTTLSLPGQFNDPLRLAGILDTSQLQGHLDFIRWLGAADLTLHDYAVTHVPNAVEAGLDDELLRRLIALLAEHIGELLDDDPAHEALSKLSLVECEDGLFRSGPDCYFADSPVTLVLGPQAPIAIPGSPAQRQLLGWLGVESLPRPSDLHRRIVDLTTNTPTESSRDSVTTIFDHLGQRAEVVAADPDDWKFLRELAWLPVEDDDSWHIPSSVYAGFSRYLFESQALFLDIPAPMQARGTRLMEVLNIESQPTTKQVVDHLLHQASQGLPINREVYRRLNDHASEPEIDSLVGTACLQTAQGKYVLPSHTYWRDHPFGTYRYRLSEDLLQFRQLLDALGVHEEAGWKEAIDVLTEVSADHGRNNQPLDDADHSILLSCWRLIQEAAPDHSDVASASVRARKCVPDRNRVLTIPQYLVFQDDQYLAARFQEDLGANLIEREAGVWPAMARAGVQLLSHAVQRNLAMREEARVAPDLRERVVRRALQLTRVVQSVDPQSDTRLLLERLQSLGFEVCSGIEVDLELDALGLRVTKRESMPAFFDEETNTLSAVTRGGSTYGDLNWVSFSRELARACCPDDEAGQFTFGFKEVLTANSEVEANLALDEAGIASLTATVTAGVASETITGIGDDGPQPRPERVLAAVPQDGSAGDPLDSMEPSGSFADELPTDSGETPSVDDLTAEATTRPSSSHKTDPSSRFGRPIAVVTVVPSDASEPDPDPETERWRNEVDRSGIERVLAFERAAGRFPTEMSHGNPGYDIESRDDKGNLIRYIEVKSLGGMWSENVAMTGVQFRFAQTKGPQAWLYVVPEALHESGPPIMRIQDPTGTATRFRFDRGWSGFAEPDGAEPGPALQYGDLLPQTAALLSALDKRGAPTPTIPYWISGPTGESEWKAEAAWPDFRVIVVEESDSRRDEWLSIQGWTIVLPQEWEVDEVAQLLGNDSSRPAE